MNFATSSLYFSSNTPEGIKLSCANALNVPIANAPGKYLGLPTHWGKSKNEALAYVLDRVTSRITGWKQKFLSQAGNEVLIKAIATVVPAYLMACFQLPTTLCNKITLS